ncbi:MAG: LPS assembly lipoprotein LptE [Phycisphaerales bacterium]
MIRLALSALLLAVLACAPGCASDPSRGYSFGAAYSDDIRTIATPIFDNVTFSHGLESLLAEAVVKEIHRTTPWGVTAPGAADTTLSGSITEVTLRKLNTDSTSGFVSELAVDISIDFEWRDNRSGQTILTRRNFRGVGSFAPGTGAGEPIELGEQAAVERLAAAIVNELRSDW